VVAVSVLHCEVVVDEAWFEEELALFRLKENMSCSERKSSRKVGGDILVVGDSIASPTSSLPCSLAAIRASMRVGWERILGDERVPGVVGREGLGEQGGKGEYPPLGGAA